MLNPRRLLWSCESWDEISTAMNLQVSLKTGFDIISSLVVVTLLLPVFLIVIVSIKLDSSGPVLFRQIRLGRNQKQFEILKFRTMVVDENRREEQTLNNSAGVTRVGSLLRRFKLDELPQLLNVLCGQMSIVGPRPCLPSTLKDMDEYARRRFTVKPGLTGLAQVNGNASIEWADRWQYDVYYVEQHSALMDFRILLKTVLVVLFGEERFKKLFNNANSTHRIG